MAYSELTEKQKIFCDEYLIDLNGTRAAKSAGYSEDTATEQASRLLTNVKVIEYLSYRQKERLARTEISQDAVLQEFAKIAFVDIREFYDEENNLKPIARLNDRCAAALAGIDVDEIIQDRQVIGQTKKIKLHSKIAALDALGKHTGIYAKDNEQIKPVVPDSFEITIIKPLVD